MARSVLGQVGCAVASALALSALGLGCASRPSARWTPLADVNSPSSYAVAPSNGSTMLVGSTRVVEAPSARTDLGAMEAPRATPRRPAPSTGTGAAPSVGLDAAGQVITSNDFRGKVVVLDFWATWCGPCKASSPAFQQLAERFAGDPRVMTLAIHTDHTGDPKAYMREHGYTFRMVPRGQEFASAYNVNVLPTFIILDARGREIYRDTGMMGDSQRAEVERLVRASLR